MVEHKLASFATVIALWTLVTLLPNADSLTPKVEIPTRQKLCHFGRSFSAKAILLCKKFRSDHRAGVFISENFHSGYRDLVNRASQASHMNTSKFLQRK